MESGGKMRALLLRKGKEVDRREGRGRKGRGRDLLDQCQSAPYAPVYLDLLIYASWSIKNVPPKFCLYFRQILTDFNNSFTGTLSGQFTKKPLVKFPPHLKRVATLPCETRML